MLIVSEYKLTDKELNNYMMKGHRVAYGYEKPKARRGEAVGFLLDTMYKSTIDMIEYLLYTKHKVTLKYDGINYHLSTLDEWHRTYTENKRTMHYKHPLYIEYEAKRQAYFENLERIKNKKRQEDLLEQYDFEKVPEDLDAFVDTFSRLYNIQVDMSSETDKLIWYNQIRTYIELDIPYRSYDIDDATSIEGQQFIYNNCIDIEESPFKKEMFQDVEYQENISVETFGDEVYLEDTIYKGE